MLLLQADGFLLPVYAEQMALIKLLIGCQFPFQRCPPKSMVGTSWIPWVLASIAETNLLDKAVLATHLATLVASPGFMLAFLTQSGVEWP